MMRIIVIRAVIIVGMLWFLRQSGVIGWVIYTLTGGYLTIVLEHLDKLAVKYENIDY